MKLFRALDRTMTPRLLFWRQLCSQAELTTVTEERGVRQIILNNPNKRNALSLAMLERLHDNLTSGTEKDSLRCIVLKSSGSVFSSGHDLKELKQSNEEGRQKIFGKCSDLMVGIRKIPVPVIAQVNGLAAAAGCQLVASCDIVIATSKSQFSTPGASVGLFCSTPGVAVSRAVPQKIASYMLFTGNNISAQEALQSGLVSKVVTEEEIEQETSALVEAILKKSRSVLALGKEFFYQQLREDITSAYQKGSEVMVDNLSLDEAHEGISAFFEKRNPVWQHTMKKSS